MSVRSSGLKGVSALPIKRGAGGAGFGEEGEKMIAPKKAVLVTTSRTLKVEEISS